MSAQSWQDAFLGVSAILGEPLDASLAALGDDSAAATESLVAALRSASRDVRARAMAREVTTLLVGIDDMRLK
jgi:hypothetical protein